MRFDLGAVAAEFQRLKNRIRELESEVSQQKEYIKALVIIADTAVTENQVITDPQRIREAFERDCG